MSSRAPWLELPSSFYLRVASGYVPLATTGFEVSIAPITAEEIEDHKAALKEAGDEEDDYLAILRASDICVTFSCKDDNEISAAKIVPGALTILCGGFLCDPQQDITVEGRYLDVA